jgi:energy-coupling factor transport system ATP-binding protein
MYVGQDPDTCLLAPTVLEELAFHSIIRGRAWNEALKLGISLAEEAGISKLLFRRITTLSQGEKQLVTALSVAASNALLAVFDEPFSMLDTIAFDVLCRALSRLSQRGCSLVITGIPSGWGEHKHETLNIQIVDDLRSIISAQNIAPASTLIQEGDGVNLESFNQLFTPLNHLATLNLEEVGYWYEDEWSLSPQSHSFYGGDIVLFFGPNGCGKSTLLRLIAGIQKPRKGSIHLDGIDVKSKGMRPLKIAYVPQNPEHAVLAYTVRDELLLNCRGSKQPQERNEQILSLWQRIWSPESPLERNPRSLSFGQKKMLSIVASGFLADLIIIDEPFLGLDFRRTAWLTLLLECLRRNGRIVILSGHSAQLPNLNAKPICLELNR